MAAPRKRKQRTGPPLGAGKRGMTYKPFGSGRSKRPPSPRRVGVPTKNVMAAQRTKARLYEDGSYGPPGSAGKRRKAPPPPPSRRR